MTAVEWKPAGDEWGKVYRPTPDVRTWQRLLAEAYERENGQPRLPPHSQDTLD